MLKLMLAELEPDELLELEELDDELLELEELDDEDELLELEEELDDERPELDVELLGTLVPELLELEDEELELLLELEDELELDDELELVVVVAHEITCTSPITSSESMLGRPAAVVARI